MNVSTTGESRPLSYAEAHYQESLRIARKRVKDIRSFYISASMYAVIIPILWVINLSTGTRLWAQWATIGWGLGLVVQGLTVFAGRSFFGTEWEQKKVDEIMAREKLKVVSSEKQLMQAQMRMLQAQIEPHFLFNTLANVQSLIDISPAMAKQMLGLFNDYLRASLARTRDAQATVRQELDLLRAYLGILQIRMADRLSFDIDCPDSLLEQALPPMLLQPLVENAVRHGLEPKVEGGTVRIRLALQDGQLIAEVSDDGLGLPAQVHGQGVGLANVRARLATLYGGQARLVLHAQPAGGTRARISLPLETS